MKNLKGGETFYYGTYSTPEEPTIKRPCKLVVLAPASSKLVCKAFEDSSPDYWVATCDELGMLSLIARTEVEKTKEASV